MPKKADIEEFHPITLERWRGVTPYELVCSSGGERVSGRRMWENYHFLWDAFKSGIEAPEVLAELLGRQYEKEGRKGEGKNMSVKVERWLGGNHFYALKEVEWLFQQGFFTEQFTGNSQATNTGNRDYRVLTPFTAQNRSFMLMVLLAALREDGGAAANTRKSTGVCTAIDRRKYPEKVGSAIGKILDNLRVKGWWGMQQESNQQSMAAKPLARLLEYGLTNPMLPNMEKNTFPLPVHLAVASLDAPTTSSASRSKASQIIADRINVLLATRLSGERTTTHLPAVSSESVRDQRQEMLLRLFRIAEVDPNHLRVVRSSQRRNGRFTTRIERRGLSETFMDDRVRIIMERFREEMENI